MMFAFSAEYEKCPLNFMINKMLFDGRHFWAQTRRGGSGGNAARRRSCGGRRRDDRAAGAQFGSTRHNTARAGEDAGVAQDFQSDPVEGFLVAVSRGVCGGGEYVGKHPA